MKSLSFFKRSKPPSASVEGEVDIDVRPMMNVLLILIPFLVSVAEYTHLSIVEMSLPPNVGAGISAAPSEKPKIKLTVVVAPTFLAITSGEKMLDSIGRTNAEYDFSVLAAKLKLRREEAEVQDEMLVAVRDVIPFKHVVRVMDICRESGFEKVGLAAATEDPETGH